MGFNIIEQFIAGKTNNFQLCEDAIFVNDSFVAIIDGATSKSELTFEGKSTGKVASELIAQTIANFSPDINSSEAVEVLSQNIFQFYEVHNLVSRMKKQTYDRLAASVAIYSYTCQEVWLIGDCQCIIGENYYSNEKIIDQILANTRALFIHIAIQKGAQLQDLLRFDTGREYIYPLLKEQSFFQNNPSSAYAYGVIDGFEINQDQIKVIKVDNSTIILASDGYPKLFANLVDSEKYLQDMIKNDPLCIHTHKSTKGLTTNQLSFDDRAYIKIEQNLISSN